MTYLPLQIDHIRVLTPCESQGEEYAAVLTSAQAGGLERVLGLSAWAGARCIGVGGVQLLWPGRAEAFGLFGRATGPYMRGVIRHIKFVLDTYPCRRLELTVKAGNVQGHHIAKLLGFGNPECYLRAYHPDGSDMYMYARIK